jgi:glycosyltransferase involved in cell wall biosynthesis
MHHPRPASFTIPRVSEAIQPPGAFQVEAANLERLEELVYSRKQDEAGRELIVLLQRLRIAGAFIDAMAGVQPERRRDCARLAAAISTLLSDPGFQPTVEGFDWFALEHPTLHDVFRCSGFGNADHLVHRFSAADRLDPLGPRVARAGEVAKLLLAYSLESEYELDFERIVQEVPRLALPAFLGMLGHAVDLSPRAQARRAKLLALGPRFARIDAVDLRGRLDPQVPSMPPDSAVRYVLCLGERIGFKKPAPFDRNRRVFDELLLPLLRWLVEAGLFDHVLWLEALVYERHVLQVEREEHFRHCMRAMAPMIARGVEDSFPCRGGADRASAFSESRRVAFFVHVASSYGQVEVLMNMLRGYRALPEQSFEPIVYCFQGRDEKLDDWLAELAIKVVYLDQAYPETANRPFLRLRRLGERLKSDRVDVLVWVSVPLMLAAGFALRLAPLQIWWAMKYHDFELPQIDRYLAVGAIAKERTISDRKWRSVPMRQDDWRDDSLAEAGRALRSRWPGKTVLASLGREEKLNDPSFLSCVCRILKHHPQSVFLWTGRARDRGIQAAFDEASLGDRTCFLGWVDTRLYAHVLDVFLDSFPFPCGLTAFQAMAQGKPVLLYESREARETGLVGSLLPILEGSEGDDATREEVQRIFHRAGESGYLPYAGHPDQYVRIASRLIEDPDYRRACGVAARELIERFMTDTRLMGRDFANHLKDMLRAERRASPGAHDQRP